MLNKMDISKFLLDVFGEMVDVEGGCWCPPIILTIKKGNRPFNFQTNEPFSKFSYDNK